MHGIINNLKKLPLVLKFIGVGNTIRTVQYALKRDILDALASTRRGFNYRSTRLAPGELQIVNLSEVGGSFGFENANLEMVFLAPDLVRLTWEPGLLPIPYAIEREIWPSVNLVQENGEGYTNFHSPALNVQLFHDGCLRFSDHQQHLLWQTLPPLRHGHRWEQMAKLTSEEHVYGLGQRAVSLNLRPGKYRTWNTDPGGSYSAGDDPLYLSVPSYIGLHSQGSYLVFFENSFEGRWTFSDQFNVIFNGGTLRYYFIPGPPDRALARFCELTGRPALPPRWALGFHQSRWGYQDTDRVREIAQGFAAHELPVSAIHLDIDYMDGFRVFTMDPDHFADIISLAEELASQGINLVAILDCGVKWDPNYRQFEEGLKKRMFCTTTTGSPLTAPVWPGWSVFPDFSDPEVRAWWGDQYPKLYNAGFSGVWHDMNEPATFAAWGEPTLPLSTQHKLDGRGGDHQEAHNLYALLMGMAGFEATRKHRPDRRPWLLTRSGWAGIQRFAWHWTGDTASDWATLRQTIPTVLGLGLSGIPYSGPDIGGFSGSPGAELYTRWFQMAALMPFFRSHAAIGTPDQEPWAFGQPYLDVMRVALQLRYSLMAYLYTLAWDTSKTGLPLVRPLWWATPEFQPMWDRQDAYLLGDAILVAPVLHPQRHVRTLSLPPGRWYRFGGDSFYTGPGEVDLEAPLEVIPILIQGGHILPLVEAETLTLHLFTDEKGEAEGKIYSDAGDGFGEWRLDCFSLKRTEENIVLNWVQTGDYLFPYDRVFLHLHGFEASKVWVDGSEINIESNKVEVGFFSSTLFQE